MLVGGHCAGGRGRGVGHISLRGGCAEVGLQVHVLRHGHLVLPCGRRPAGQQLQVVIAVGGDVGQRDALDGGVRGPVVIYLYLHLRQHAHHDEVLCSIGFSDGLHVAHGDALLAEAIVGGGGVEVVAIDGGGLRVGSGDRSRDADVRGCTADGGHGGGGCQAEERAYILHGDIGKTVHGVIASQHIAHLVNLAVIVLSMAFGRSAGDAFHHATVLRVGNDHHPDVHHLVIGGVDIVPWGARPHRRGLAPSGGTQLQPQRGAVAKHALAVDLLIGAGGHHGSEGCEHQD